MSSTDSERIAAGCNAIEDRIKELAANLEWRVKQLATALNTEHEKSLYPVLYSDHWELLRVAFKTTSRHLKECPERDETITKVLKELEIKYQPIKEELWAIYQGRTDTSKIGGQCQLSEEEMCQAVDNSRDWKLPPGLTVFDVMLLAELKSDTPLINQWVEILANRPGVNIVKGGSIGSESGTEKSGASGPITGGASLDVDTNMEDSEEELELSDAANTSMKRTATEAGSKDDGNEDRKNRQRIG